MVELQLAGNAGFRTKCTPTDDIQRLGFQIKFSDSKRILALTSGSKVLVTSTKAVYLVDLETEEIRIIDSGHGLYYGLTWDREHYIVGCVHHYRFLSAFPVLRRLGRPKLLTIDKDLKTVRPMPCPFHFLRFEVLHQIYYDARRHTLFAILTRNNGILMLQEDSWWLWIPRFETLAQWRARVGKDAKKSADQPNCDIHHLNSVWCNHNEIYLVAHNWGPSEVWVLDSKSLSLQRRVSVGRCAHNVWTEGDEILVCSSADGRVVNHYGDVRYELNGFIRGAAITEELRVFGESTIATRNNRVDSDGAIHVLDGQWNLKKKIWLRGAGQVNEVRLLTGDDLCHNDLLPPGSPAPSKNLSRHHAWVRT